MLKHNFGEAYLRRLHPKDRAASLTEGIRLGCVALMREHYRKPAYVMIRRGYPNQVLACAPTKHELAQAITAQGNLRESLRWFRCQRED